MKTLAALAPFLFVLQIEAGTITYNANTDFIFPPPGTRFTATGGTGSLALNVVANWLSLGIHGGPSGPEIGIDEALTITFDTPANVSELTIALLFDGPEFGDANEIAAVSAGGATYTLTAVGTSTATWTGPGSVANVSPAIEGAAAVWRITDPFGSDSVSSIQLLALSSNPLGNESDFGLQSFTFEPAGVDIVAKNFSYAVYGDQNNTINGPIPVNANLTFGAEISNEGTEDVGPFDMQVILSSVSTPEQSILLKTLHIAGVPAGESVVFTRGANNTTVSMESVYIDQSFWFGAVKLGMVVDPARPTTPNGAVEESDESNNQRLLDTVLFDRIYNFRLAATVPTQQIAEKYLENQGFEYLFYPIPFNIAHWSKNLPAGNTIRSWFNGVNMPSEAFRLHAIIEGEPPNVEISIQGDFEFVNNGPAPNLPSQAILGPVDPRGLILPTAGEPDPGWAFFVGLPLGWVDWLQYVRQYHDHF